MARTNMLRDKKQFVSCKCLHNLLKLKQCTSHNFDSFCITVLPFNDDDDDVEFCFCLFKNRFFGLDLDETPKNEVTVNNMTIIKPAHSRKDKNTKLSFTWRSQIKLSEKSNSINLKVMTKLDMVLTIGITTCLLYWMGGIARTNLFRVSNGNSSQKWNSC